MKLSLSGRILQGGPAMTTPEFIQLARDTGFDLVELRANQVPVDSSEADLASLRQVLQEAGIGVSMLVTGGLDELERWVRVAQALDVVNLRASGTAAKLAAAAEQLPENLRLVCQMHSGSEFENVSQAVAALADIPSPRFGLMPEPANLLFAGEIWSADLLQPLAGRIYGCNAQSIALDPHSDTSVPMNDGTSVPYSRLDWPANSVLDFPGFVASLRAVGYDDFINFIDPFHPDLTVHDLATSTAAYARQILS